MNVKQLKAVIANLPDETPIVVSGSDHSYLSAEAMATTALQEGRNQWTEDFGEESTPEKDYGKRVKVLPVG